jgi:hypothetical protein
MNNQYIAVKDVTNDRVSSVCLERDRMTICGILPHGTGIEPSSTQDAYRLIEWLNEWISQNACKIQHDEK